MDADWLRFALAALACWRVTALLVYDDGPWDLGLRLRRAAGDGALGRMLDCQRCTSLWVAAPFALVVGHGLLDWLLAWLALSGAACLLDRLGQPPLRIEPAPQGDEDHGMLWIQPHGAGDAGAAAAPRADPASAAGDPPRGAP